MKVIVMAGVIALALSVASCGGRPEANWDVPAAPGTGPTVVGPAAGPQTEEDRVVAPRKPVVAAPAAPAIAPVAEPVEPVIAGMRQIAAECRAAGKVACAEACTLNANQAESDHRAYLDALRSGPAVSDEQVRSHAAGLEGLRDGCQAVEKLLR
ncbi:MAG: hypothetical protein WCO00_00235 [Rhodospirillaceae bacterium]